MIVVIARRDDTVARSLVARWAAYNAVLLTCQDLSVIGWRHYLGAKAQSTAVLSGKVIAVKNIAAVFNRLPYIGETDLPQIAPDERGYVATEMSAFLMAWLSALPCPVLNRPRPPSLCGPNWRRAQWVYAAGRLGVSVRTLQMRATLATDTPFESRTSGSVTITVVGNRCFGVADEVLTSSARCLAVASGADVLAVEFSVNETGAGFLDVNLVPDVSSPEIAEAVLEHMLRDGRC